MSESEEAPMGITPRRIRSKAVLAAGSLAAMILLAAVAVGPMARAGARATCQHTGRPSYVATKAVTTFSPANDRTTKPPPVDFGTSRQSEDVAPYTFTVGGPQPDLGKISWDLLLVNGNRTFPDSHASVTLSDALGNVRLSLCLSPSGVPAGTYSGGLSLGGAGLRPVQVPLTVNLKDNNLAMIWLGVVGAALAAVFVKWWTMRVSDISEPNGAKIRDFYLWLKSQWVTISLAIAGAVGGVYVTKFLNRESFTTAERLGLWVSVFTAVMSASLLLNALGLAVEPKKGDNPKSSH